MTAQEFFDRLIRRWPALMVGKPGELPRPTAAADDIKAYLGKINDRHLERLWDEFSITYDNQYPPRVASLNKVSVALGILRMGTSGKIPMYRCDCGAEFSPASRACPKCGTGDRAKFYVVMVEGQNQSDRIDPPRKPERQIKQEVLI